MKKEALLRELAKLTADGDLRADEFTFEEYHAECLKSNPRLTTDASRNVLTRLVKNGKLNARKVRMSGRQCNAYSAK